MGTARELRERRAVTDALIVKLASDQPDWTQGRLAEESGCSRFTVRRVLHSQGLYEHRHPPIDRARICKVAADNPDWPTRRLAAAIGYSKDTVVRVLREEHEEPRRPSRDECPCPLCGKPFVVAGSHFVRVHGMTAKEVRQATGLPTVAPATSVRLGLELREHTGRARYTAGEMLLSVDWTDDEILAAIRAHHRKMGNAPGVRTWEVARASHPCSAVVKRRFGSWGAALDAAGVPRRRHKRFRMTAARKAGYARRRKLVAKVCPVCSTTFERRPCRSHQVTCSRACRDVLGRTLPDLLCRTCGTLFHVRDRGQVYCSLRCRPTRSTPAREAVWAAKRGRRSRWVTKVCPICGTTFERNPARAHESTCSRSCGQALRHLLRRSGDAGIRRQAQRNA